MESFIILWGLIGLIFLVTMLVSFYHKWSALKRKDIVIKLDREEVTISISDENDE